MEENFMKTKMRFEDLDAWKRARELVNGVYSLCRDSGVAKDFGLRDQIQRAAVSAGKTAELRDLAADVGRLSSGLIGSTQRRPIAKAGAGVLLAFPICYLLSSLF